MPRGTHIQQQLHMLLAYAEAGISDLIVSTVAEFHAFGKGWFLRFWVSRICVPSGDIAELFARDGDPVIRRSASAEAHPNNRKLLAGKLLAKRIGYL